MNAATRSVVAAGALFAALAAQAGTGMSSQNDGYHYSNGGTGYIGLTASAGEPRTMTRYSGATMAAGEATTMIGGQPNRNPDTVASSASAPDAASTRAMGNGPEARIWSAARNPSWGTPD